MPWKSDRFEFEVTIEMPVEPAIAFHFLENPESMRSLPGVIEASGDMKIGGSGVIRFANGIENRWRVVEYDPPRRCVIHQEFTAPLPGNRTDRFAALETSLYEEAEQGCRVRRTTVVTLHGRKALYFDRRTTKARWARGSRETLGYLRDVLVQQRG